MVVKQHVRILSIAFLSALAACEDVNSPVNPTVADASLASNHEAGATAAGPVATVLVTPPSDTAQIGDTLRWTAQAVDASGQAVTSGVTYTWGNPGNDLFGYAAKSGNTAKGVARGLGRDTAVVTVTVSGGTFKGYGHLLIVAAGTTPPPSTTPPPGDSTPTAPVSVAAVSVTLNPASLTVGQTSQATAIARDAAGQPIAGRAVTWSSNKTSVATVSSSGAVNGLAAGSATISAAIDGITGSADITVTAPTAPPSTGDAVVLAPGQDIQAAVNARPAGTTFRLTAGVYRNQHVVPKSGNTFVGDPGAVLDGGNATAYAFDKGSAPYPSKVTIKGLEIRAYASADHMGPILAGGGLSDGTYGWVIDGVDVHNNRVGGVRVGHHTIVRNSKFHHNGWFGLSGAGDSVLVENNEIGYNNVPGTPGTVQCDPNWGGGGFKFVYTRWLVVRNNYSHHNSGAGMWTDINNIYTTYDGNRVEDNTHVGIFHEISYDAVIKNNAVRRNGFGKANWLWGAGILIAASPRVEAFGNTVEGNYNGVTVVQQTRGEKATYGPHMVDDVWVHDNDIDMSAGGVTGFGQDVGDNSLYNLSVVKFSGNRYMLGSSTRPYHWMNGLKTESEWKSYGEDQSGTFSR